MNVHTYTLGQLSTNCYLIENGKQAVIIDPVDSADFLLEEISRHNLTLMALLATHGHFDHILAAGEIQLAFTGARSVPLYLNENDVFLVNRMEQSARYFLGYNPVTIKPSMIEPLQDGVLNVEPFQFVVIPTPGHTPGSVSFYWNNQSTLFPVIPYLLVQSGGLTSVIAAKKT